MIAAGGYYLSPTSLLTWHFHPFLFSGIAVLMSADIVRNPYQWSVAVFNSYYTFRLFQLLILFQTGCFLN